MEKLKHAIEKHDAWYRMIKKVGKWELLAWTIAWEGNISLNKSKYKRGSGFSLMPLIAVANTNLELLKRFEETIKFGTIYVHRRHKITKEWQKRRRTLHQWHCRKLKDLKIILEKIIPILPSKEKQGNLLLEYVNIRLKNIKAPYGKRELEIYEEMRELNKRGLEIEKSIWQPEPTF